MLLSETKQAQESDESEEIPDKFRVGTFASHSTHGLGTHAAALGILSGSRTNQGASQEQ
jgi:predicted methyltransferase MtxX (methanogen marker protein 4)